MTVILVSAIIFVVGLAMIFAFRSVVSTDDDLERKLLEARQALADRKSTVDGKGTPGATMTPPDQDEGS